MNISSRRERYGLFLLLAFWAEAAQLGDSIAQQSLDKILKDWDP